jgi:hypothetical protein
MKNIILTIAVCASIASARAATQTVLSNGNGQTAALLSSTAVLASDSPLVRAAKLTVAGRLHSGTTQVVNDTTVAHPMRVLGVSAPGSVASVGTATAATMPAAASSAPVMSPSPAAPATGAAYGVAGAPANAKPEQRH